MTSRVDQTKHCVRPDKSLLRRLGRVNIIHSANPDVDVLTLSSSNLALLPSLHCRKITILNPDNVGRGQSETRLQLDQLPQPLTNVRILDRKSTRLNS